MSESLPEALATIESQKAEIDRLERELEETNRGVLALYAELDDKAESLRKASEEKTRFLSNMSHEFRTPLNSILSLGQILAQESDGPLTDEQKKQVQFIRSAAQSLSEMVNDLLDIAKIEAGRITVRPIEFDLGDLLVALRGMFRPQHHNQEVTLHFEPLTGERTVFTDEGKLTQVVRNFLSNAMKFTERGSITVSAEVTESQVRISVADTGIGIPEDQLGAIFEEFVQVDNRLQRRAKGTGLGLALSRRLAHLLGGEITVESRLGEGSVFTVSIARFYAPTTEVAPAASTVRPLPRETGELKVLIIDDDEAARYLFKDLLPEGCLVAEAASGAEGLEKARAWAPSLVVLDLTMPLMDGFEVARRLRSEAATRLIPIIFYTSRTLSADEQHRVNAFGLGLVPKGAERDEAAALVQNFFRAAGLRTGQ
jgi:signal transduction histidine kinase